MISVDWNEKEIVGKMTRLMITIAFVAVLAGCGEKEAANPAKPSVPKGTLTYETMATNDVIVVANGVPLTKGDVERQIAVQKELVRIANPHMKLTEIERRANSFRRGAERLHIQRRTMVAEAERRGFIVTENDRKEMREGFAKRVLRGRAKYGLLAGKLDADKRAALDAGLDLDVLCQKVNDAIRKECRVVVTQEEAEKKFHDIEAYNARAKADEAKIWKSASNVWERIRGGEDFEKAAVRVMDGNEHVNSDMDWGEFELDFFKDDTALCHYLTVMPEGTVAPPLPGDNGILIVKMLAKLPVDFGTGRLKPHYRLAKIFFELPEFYPLESVDALKVELEKMRMDDAFKKKISELEAAVKLEYPNGKVIMGSPRKPFNALHMKK